MQHDPVDFKIHSRLSPAIWKDDDLKPAVREKLLAISDKFLDYLEMGVEPDDILFTGSLAGYMFSFYSDVDLHLVFDAEKHGWYKDGELDPKIKELWTAKKTLWNEHHDIVIAGYEVELYVQDSKEELTAAGKYSVLRGEWIVKPEREDRVIDYPAIKMKASEVMDAIDRALESGASPKTLEGLKEKIRNMRRAGLSTVGEFSIENLAFKVLRRNGYLEKLSKADRMATDKELSLESLLAWTLIG